VNIGTFILKNAARNKRRLLLSVLSAAVSLFLLVTLMVVLRELTKPPSDGDSSLRVCVRNKVSLAATLPQRQLADIEKVPGVVTVSPFVWFGGKFQEDEQLIFGTIACDPVKLPTLLQELKLDPDQYAEFVKDRTACLVGQDAIDSEKFKSMGLKVGSKFTVMSGIYPCSLELKIVGTYKGTIDDRNIFFHHKYLDEALGDWGNTGMWWLRIDNAASMGPVNTTIEALFANTANEVRAESERAFQMSFVSMWGGIKDLIGGISILVVFTLFLVTASTMSMAIRERFRELGILKAIGFQRSELFAFILAESFGLSALGAVIGAGGAWALYQFADMKKATGGFFVSFEVTPQMLGTAALIACILGILSSLAPAIAVARMSVVQALKTLD
jgi:putative ABC transport system permease protein